MNSYNKNTPYSYTLGISVTIELLVYQPNQINKIFIRENINKETGYNRLISLCEKNNIKAEVNNKIFNKLKAKDNCFVIGEFSKYTTIMTEGNHLLLVNPENDGNLGTIIRSALGFGIKNIGIIKPAVDCFDPKVIRSSMGAIFNVNINYFDSLDEYINKFSKNNLYPFMLKAKTKLSNIKFNKYYTLIFGPESSGLNDEYLNVGKPVIISHDNSIDSLNLPIALSIALYEATKDDFN